MNIQTGRLGRAAREALAEAYEQHYSHLVRLSGLLLGNREAAEDLVMDVFVRSAPRIAEVAAEGRGAYLRAAVANAWRNRMRRAALERRIRPKLWRSDRVAEPDLDERDEMWRAILRLPVKQRACLVLRFYEEQSEQEAADLLGVSVGTVKSQTSRALRKLRKEFER